jgi:hypothetical protein
MKQQLSCQQAAEVSYSNQERLQNAFGQKAPTMRAKPRCGHGMSFSKEQEGQAANYFFEAAGSGNLPSRQFQLPLQTSLATVACRS